MVKKLIYIAIFILLIAGIFFWIGSNKDEPKDIMICTMEYAPVCGVDDITYSNACMAESQNIEIAHEGECQNMQMANPASEYCIQNGGELTIKQGPLGEYGVCTFEDNKACEEWALFSGECPIGGVKIAGYDNEEQIYCAIRGGEVDMDNATCILNNNTFNLTDYYNGGQAK